MRGGSNTRYRTVARSVSLFQSFLVEQSDPDHFYSEMASDTVQLIRRHEELLGRVVLDVGAGDGRFRSDFENAGASYLALDPTPSLGQDSMDRIRAEGERLPLADSSIDVVMSSNVMEHVSQPGHIAEEMLRVLKPGGLLFISYTAWYGPWGGHETSPWHLLGGHFARRRFERKNGRPPKNRFGETMH
ncbi:MAG TPA: class I SAM-dependent methyltransferase, partial [Brevibacterium sp.]|nr:class I SAM-dependent methyltransferase [Brevibacterium sp.]